MEESENLRRATELWRAAYRYQMEGELDRAIEDYQRSIAVYPTAEAHTFLGWTASRFYADASLRTRETALPHTRSGWE